MEFSLQARRLLENGQHGRLGCKCHRAARRQTDGIFTASPRTSRNDQILRKQEKNLLHASYSKAFAVSGKKKHQHRRATYLPTYLPTYLRYLPYMLRLAVFSCRECLNSWREEDVTVKSAGATEPPADRLMEFSPQARRLLKTVNTAVPGASATESWAD